MPYDPHGPASAASGITPEVTEKTLAVFDAGPLSARPVSAPLYRAMDAVLGQSARRLVATDRRLIVDYGHGQSTTIHYTPGIEVGLFRNAPSYPLQALILRFIFAFLALGLLATGFPYSMLGALILVLVVLGFLRDSFVSGVEVLVPYYDREAAWRVSPVFVLNLWGWRRLREFVDCLNDAVAVEPVANEEVRHDLR